MEGLLPTVDEGTTQQTITNKPSIFLRNLPSVEEGFYARRRKLLDIIDTKPGPLMTF